MTIPVWTAAIAAAVQPAPPVAWTTLGTEGGPIPNPARSQPANLLTIGAQPVLVDCGDGAVERLAAAGVRLDAVRTVFVSHLHFDHTAGLAGLIALRYQGGAAGVLTIYGPPGIRETVAGVLAMMRPGVEVGLGEPGERHPDPAAQVRVEEIAGGAVVPLAGGSVTVAENSHYSFAAGSDAAARFKSLSFRFALPGRTIVYTGDTGPSAAVERLAGGADLLVSEMIDVEATVANIRRANPAIPAPVLAGIVRHLREHHLTPAEVGDLARRAGVAAVAVTHQSPGSTDPADLARYQAAIAARFPGQVAIAHDLQRF